VISRESVSRAVTVLRLDHGAVSALDLELLDALRKEIADLASEGVALVLTGTGPAFSAGVDLFRILDGGEPYSERYLTALIGLFDELFRHPRPVVAAVNGHAIAGGCVVACTGDYRLMSAGRGRIGVPEMLVGVPFPALGLEIVRFATADRGIQSLLYTGSLLLPEEAKDQGLVDEVVPAEELLERAVARAQQMAAIPPATFWHTKWSLRGPVLQRAEDNGRRLDAEMRHIWASAETAAAISNYVNTTFGSGR
jgi:enoyl-CoA hydratase/carnithine racemase